MDRRTMLGLAASAAGVAAVSPGGRAEAGVVVRAAGTAGRRYGPAMTALRDYMDAHIKAHNLPGLTLCVVDADGFSAEIQAGYADIATKTPVRPDHLFQIGSISKSFAGICIIKRIEEGKLSLDTPVRDILPEVRLPKGVKVTVRNLLDHSSGLPHDVPVFTRANGGELWLGFEPGTRWSYSNTAYIMLGMILEQIDGKPFGEIVQRDVLTPLKMTRAAGVMSSEDRPRYAGGYSPLWRDRAQPRGGPLAAGAWVDMQEASGCIAATAGDMALYVRWLIEAGSGRGAPVMSDASAKLFVSPSMDAPGWAKDAKYGHGLAVVQIDGRELLHHTGGMVTFSSSLHVDVAAGVGSFASSNVGMTGYRPRAITIYACALMRAVADGGALPKPPPTHGELTNGADYVGVFRSASGGAIDLRMGKGGLVAMIGGRETEVQPLGDNALLIVDPAWLRYPLAFERKDKKVVALWFGPEQYALSAADLSKARPSAADLARAGRYDNDDPWNGVARIVARPDGLYAGGTEKLTPLGDGLYRVGAEDWSAERISFEAPLNGKPQRMTFSGVDFIRRRDP